MNGYSSEGAGNDRPRPRPHAARSTAIAPLAPLLVALAALASWPTVTPAAPALAPELEDALRTSTYVYIASKRKDGSFSEPAEIWFMYHQGAVWVASPTTTWRVRRINAGRPKARIHVGKADGPAFKARGSIVKDPAAYEEMYRTLARKYPEGWAKWEQRFRDGLADGTRVLIRYEPVKRGMKRKKKQTS